MDNNPQNNYPQNYPPNNFAPPPGQSSSNKWLWPVAVVVAVIIGGVIGWGIRSSKISNLETQISELKKQDSETEETEVKSTLSPDRFSATQAKARDTERHTDNKAVASHLETHNAQFGYYPTFENMNDSAWLEEEMRGLDKESTKDPRGNSYRYLLTSISNQYGYMPTKADGKVCDNAVAGDECIYFTLTYTLESDGSQRSIKNL